MLKMLKLVRICCSSWWECFFQLALANFFLVVSVRFFFGFHCNCGGQIGLYAAQDFAAGECVLQPRQSWKTFTDPADSTEYVLCQKVIMDQLGRTRMYALTGMVILQIACARPVFSVMVSTCPFPDIAWTHLRLFLFQTYRARIGHRIWTHMSHETFLFFRRRSNIF